MGPVAKVLLPGVKPKDSIVVEPMGFEPTTSSMPSRRAPNCATAPPRLSHASIGARGPSIWAGPVRDAKLSAQSAQMVGPAWNLVSAFVVAAGSASKTQWESGPASTLLGLQPLASDWLHTKWENRVKLARPKPK